MSDGVALVLRHPFATYAAIGVVLAVAVVLFDAHYDSAGVKGGLYWLGEIFRLPFIACRELLLTLSGGTAAAWQVAVSWVVHLAVCLLLDVAVRRIF